MQRRYSGGQEDLLFDADPDALEDGVELPYQRGETHAGGRTNPSQKSDREAMASCD